MVNTAFGLGVKIALWLETLKQIYYPGVIKL